MVIEETRENMCRKLLIIQRNIDLLKRIIALKKFQIGMVWFDLIPELEEEINKRVMELKAKFDEILTTLSQKTDKA